MNALKTWVTESRQHERSDPRRYLKYYVDSGKVRCDDKHAYMSLFTLEEIERSCGRYDGTLPTGVYCGKVFLRHNFFMWIGISKSDPMTQVAFNSRLIVTETL